MYHFIKRLMDILVSVIALILLLPIFLPIIIILKLTGEGEVFYVQERIGLKNRPFKMIKFATMLKNSPNMGTGSITLRQDARVLPIGKILRITKLNELPQLLNVVGGQMSIVGPRPLVLKTFLAYPEAMRNLIYQSKPGITGIGSIVFRDEESLISKSKLPPQEFYNQTIAPYKGALELWYHANKSAVVDFKIILLTVWIILMPHSNLTYRILKNVPPKPF